MNQNVSSKSRTGVKVLASPMIADPLTRLQCLPHRRLAAAVVLCSKQAAASIPGALKVHAWAYGTGDYQNPQDMARWGTDSRTCAKAYELVGLGPDDIDLSVKSFITKPWDCVRPVKAADWRPPATPPWVDVYH